jgi:hypothetical protein
VSRRAVWTLAFLGVTTVAIIAELWASFDSDPQTDPWTDLIVRHIPAEITFALIGALCLWLPLHFWIRYRRKQRL